MIYDLLNNLAGYEAPIEDQIINLLKSGYQLFCAGIAHRDFLIPNSLYPFFSPDEDQLFFGWFYLYFYDTTDETIILERYFVDVYENGAIELEDNIPDIVNVTDQLMKNMIYNAYATSNFKDTYNEYPWELNMEDFFIQWRFDSNLPKKIVLFEPSESFSTIESFAQSWTKEYPQFKNVPSLSYCYGIENINYLRASGLDECVINQIKKINHYFIYKLYIGELKELVDELTKEIGNTNSEHTNNKQINIYEQINALYYNDKETFDAIFSFDKTLQYLIDKDNKNNI